jgi:type I restriction enzyme R subunit
MLKKTSWRFWIALVIKSFEGTTRPLYLEVDIVRNFIIFEKDKVTIKEIAAYHQYWAANKALESTVNARKGNKKAGIVWHTQGSGKSLTMMFYTGKLVRELDNPTIVVLTDRTISMANYSGHLEDAGISYDRSQLGPSQMSCRNCSRSLQVESYLLPFRNSSLKWAEKYPLLSDRDNIVVIADEAHRSQYGFIAKILEKER